MTEVIRREKRMGLKSQSHMINCAWLSKWVKSLPNMLLAAQISAFSVTCNCKINQKYSPSFLPFGSVIPATIASQLRHSRILGKSELGGWVPLACSWELG